MKNSNIFEMSDELRKSFVQRREWVIKYLFARGIVCRLSRNAGVRRGLPPISSRSG